VSSVQLKRLGFRLGCSTFGSTFDAPIVQHRRKNPKSNAPFTIAVHIRRGDVDLCCLPFRYLPNSHYLRLIEKYAATHADARVVIFSESKSFEPLDVFSNKGYELMFDGDVGEA
jgi:hypothetical protein